MKEVTDMARILKTIKEHRQEKGLSNENMAYELDISPSTYSKIERDEIKLTVERLIMIMDILELSGEKLFPNGDSKILNQQIYDNAVGYQVEKYYHDNKELYGKVIEAKDKLIARLEEENKILRYK